MTIFRHKKTAQLYTIFDHVGGHKLLGHWLEAIPYKWVGKSIGRKGPFCNLKNFEKFAEVPYRLPITRITQ